MSKIVFLGNSGVGKSSILRSFKHNTFYQENTSTIGCEFFAKTITINNVEKKLLLWDTAGQEVFRSFTQNFLRGAKIIVIVYDITNEKSIDDIHIWIKEGLKLSKIKLIIVGNKSDMNTSIDYNLKIKNIINEYNNSNINIYHKQVSAKDNDEILYLFEYIGNCLDEDLSNISNENIELKKKSTIYSCC